MSNLPLGVTMILFNTAPFWSVLFGKAINGTQINGTQILLMIGSFTGVILVAIAKLITPVEVIVDPEDISELPEEEIIAEEIVEIEVKVEQNYLIGVICGVCAAFCFSILGVATRKS